MPVLECGRFIKNVDCPAAVIVLALRDAAQIIIFKIRINAVF
jgi:hypothetical protein